MKKQNFFFFFLWTTNTHSCDLYQLSVFLGSHPPVGVFTVKAEELQSAAQALPLT